MGKSWHVKCKNCGHSFSVRDGGGMAFHLLHCDRCGRAKTVLLKQIDAARHFILPSWGGAEIFLPEVTAARADFHHPPKAPGPEELAYRELVEKRAGKCRCGGHFRATAAPRCPQCQSPDYGLDEENRICASYD